MLQGWPESQSTAQKKPLPEIDIPIAPRDGTLMSSTRQRTSQACDKCRERKTKVRIVNIVQHGLAQCLNPQVLRRPPRLQEVHCAWLNMHVFLSGATHSRPNKAAAATRVGHRAADRHNVAIVLRNVTCGAGPFESTTAL